MSLLQRGMYTLITEALFILHFLFLLGLFSIEPILAQQCLTSDNIYSSVSGSTMTPQGPFSMSWYEFIMHFLLSFYRFVNPNNMTVLTMLGRITNRVTIVFLTQILSCRSSPTDGSISEVRTNDVGFALK